MRRLNDIEVVGLVFHRLTVTGRAPNYMWFALCECGKTVCYKLADMRSGKCRSCGCLNREQNQNGSQPKHGMTGTRLYKQWSDMKTRCQNPAANNYDRYGGRGIGVCQEWETFENFARDMGECPEGMTLERVNNDADYSAKNCRWASRKEQANNRSSNVLATLNGKTQSLKQWCTELNLSYSRVAQRVSKLGWTPEKALTKN